MNARDTVLTTLPVVRYGERSFAGIRGFVECDSSVLLLTMDDIFLTSNGGKSWRELVAPLPHKSVIDVVSTPDSTYVLTANGAIHRTGNNGLTWNHAARYKQGSVNTLAVTQQGIGALFVQSPKHTVTTSGGTYTLKDSTLYVSLPYGVTYTVTSPAFIEASCIATNDSMLFVGRGRLPILSVQLHGQILADVDMKHLHQEFISALLVVHSYLYVGVNSGQGGLYKKPVVGTHWETVNIDRNTESVDVQCIRSTPKGIYVGFREHGLAFIPNGSHLAYPIHEGLSGAVAQTTDPYKDDFILTARLRGLVRVGRCGVDVERFSTSLPYSGEYVAGVSDTTVVVGLHEGIVIRSKDDGTTWDTLSIRFTESAINTIRGVGPTLFICTNDGVWRSNDAGKTWARSFKELPQQNIQDVHRLPNGWLVRSNEESYLCNDDTTYTTFNPAGNFEHKPHILDVKVHDNVIYAVGYPGLFVSRDGGVTWKTYSVPDSPIVRTVSVYGDRLFITALRGQVYYVSLQVLSTL